MTALLLNPSLSAAVCFSVKDDSGVRMSRLKLREYPDIVPWLLSILDFALYSQGKIKEEKRIAAPPAGTTLQKLIEGRVVFSSERPDGGLMLRLNPEFGITLEVSARRHGACASSTTLQLAEDPELSRWLLTHFLGKSAPESISGLSSSLLARLCRHALLVEQLPAEEAWYPDPDQPVDMAAELAQAARVFRQEAAEDIPAPVRALLGRHTPILPPGKALLWGQDAGTGMVYPTIWNNPGDSPAPESLIVTSAGSRAAQRTAMWDAQRRSATESLRTRRYATLRQIVPDAHKARLSHYLRQLVARGYFPALGDGQVELRSAIHNQPTIAALHQGLAELVSDLCGERVLASYCYLSCYEAGAVLERHKDRPQCAYNLSVVFDMQCEQGEPEPWPIYLELDGKPEAVLLNVGDGLVYSGTEIWHWRDALPRGYRALVCFFHFVPLNFTGSLD